MSGRKINLEEILKKELIPTVYADNPDLTFNATIRAMREACFQLLELAAENAECEEGAIVDLGFEIISASINKDSILNTIKQVE